MALIEKARGRADGGYTRLLGDAKLGHLISRVQASTISAGTELERMIKSRVSLIDDLDAFLRDEIMPEGVQVAEKRLVKKSRTLTFDGSEPDFVVFKRRGGRQSCHVIELKDGDAFDTKKAAAEYRSLHAFIRENAQRIPYTVGAHFCCFNQENRGAIVEGFKQKIPPEEALTGREFCDLLEIAYEEIVSDRAREGEMNMRYFLDELLRIPRAAAHLGRRLEEQARRTPGG